jgi:glycosyltransferase involved in cell wall biosynthesis|tara:strand:+ start:2951 stop:3808 length:858 start_codon:yes stop_codon:yes gene_type:complete
MILKNKIKGGLRDKAIMKINTNAKPLISVITVVLNGEKYLEEAILSVVKQTYDNVEYIIIDGGSTDKTIDIIRKYEHLIDYWISEKDNGLYNAMNKGIALSRGEFIGFVGSDDYLHLDTLEKLAKVAKKQTIDFTVGPVNMIKKNGQLLEKALVLPNFLEKNRFIFNMATHHLSFYVNKKIINEVGIFDENFKIRSDYDMTISIMSISKKYYSFFDSVGAFREGGISGSYKSYFETFYILRKHGVSIFRSILNILPSLIKVFIIKNFPSLIVSFLRKIFSSGRFI